MLKIAPQILEKVEHVLKRPLDIVERAELVLIIPMCNCVTV